ncbi:MAG: hypothetical protein ACOYKA_01830 [Legionellaceae bacterium]
MKKQMQQGPEVTANLDTRAEADERLDITYLERMTLKITSGTRVRRGPLMLMAIGLSGYLHFMLLLNCIVAIFFLDAMSMRKHPRSEEEQKCLQAGDDQIDPLDDLIDPLPEVASLIIVTALCLLLHKMEKYDIDHPRRQDQQPKCTFFRKTIHHHPFVSFFFAQLLIGVGQKSVTKDCGKLSSNQLMIDGSCLLLVFSITANILKQGAVALSPRITLLNQAIKQTSLSIEQGLERLRLGSQPYLEPVSQTSTRALETTYRWSEPYVNRITNYLNEETTGLLDEGPIELQRSHLSQV